MNLEKIAYAKAIVKCAGDVSAGEYYMSRWNPFSGEKADREATQDKYLRQPHGVLKAMSMDTPTATALVGAEGAALGYLLGHLINKRKPYLGINPKYIAAGLGSISAFGAAGREVGGAMGNYLDKKLINPSPSA